MLLEENSTERLLKEGGGGTSDNQPANTVQKSES